MHRPLARTNSGRPRVPRTVDDDRSLPTIVRLAGAEPPPLPIDGKDVWPMLTAIPALAPQDAYFIFWDRGLDAVRSGQWKLHFPHQYRTLPGGAGRDGKPANYKTVKTELALFDLVADIGERTNVANDHPDVVQRLTALADRARDDLGDSLTGKTGKGVRSPADVTP